MLEEQEADRVKQGDRQSDPRVPEYPRDDHGPEGVTDEVRLAVPPGGEHVDDAGHGLARRGDVNVLPQGDVLHVQKEHLRAGRAQLEHEIDVRQNSDAEPVAKHDGRAATSREGRPRSLQRRLRACCSQLRRSVPIRYDTRRELLEARALANDLRQCRHNDACDGVEKERPVDVLDGILRDALAAHRQIGPLGHGGAAEPRGHLVHHLAELPAVLQGDLLGRAVVEEVLRQPLLDVALPERLHVRTPEPPAQLGALQPQQPLELVAGLGLHPLGLPLPQQRLRRGHRAHGKAARAAVRPAEAAGDPVAPAAAGRGQLAPALSQRQLQRPEAVPQQRQLPAACLARARRKVLLPAHGSVAHERPHVMNDLHEGPQARAARRAAPEPLGARGVAAADAVAEPTASVQEHQGEREGQHP
mmetsp:Transcript_35612/g.101854  ORF Transcript_35612/g.101854 Transcript_35612/m.101854 type:complete len:416 (+) Transcript_35612:538-1785(+)